MHENRETSGMPVGNEDSRSAGEGDSHTTRMHVAEESDSGIVPMNHSNKDGKPLAESEEGRPLVKENTHQSSTHSTQSEVRVSQGLAGVRKAAKERKGMRSEERRVGQECRSRGKPYGGRYRPRG